jgi:hypothetical protein
VRLLYIYSRTHPLHLVSSSESGTIVVEELSKRDRRGSLYNGRGLSLNNSVMNI